MLRTLIAVTLAALVSGELLIIKQADNSTEMEMVDLELQFTASLPDDGIMGLIVTADPEDACNLISPPPFPTNSTLKWFVLIKRCSCHLEVQVRNAQKAGFEGAVIYNVGTKCPISNGHSSFSSDEKIIIPGILIGESDGIQINKSYVYNHGYVIVINPESPFNLNNYLLPFAVVIGISFLVMLVFMIVKCIKDRRRSRRNRLSSRHLSQLPTQKFKKGDAYDVCAICLDEYCEGEKLRILPCSHEHAFVLDQKSMLDYKCMLFLAGQYAYHTKCIDPWLTNNRRTCPVCKRKVALKGVTPDSDSDSDAESPSERTPLIRSGSRTDGGTFSGTHLSRAVVNASGSSHEDGSDTSTGDIYQSAVCHQSSGEGEDVDAAIATSSSAPAIMVPAAHSINSEDGFESCRSSSLTWSKEVAVHVQTSDGGNKKRNQDMVV